MLDLIHQNRTQKISAHTYWVEKVDPNADAPEGQISEGKPYYNIVAIVPDVGPVAIAAYDSENDACAIFAHICEKFSLDPTACVFVDDKAENVQAARALGMQGYVFDGDAKRLRAYFNEILQGGAS